jgi:metallo-beta-lactamase class B
MMKTHRTRHFTFVAAMTVSALLALAAASDTAADIAAQIPASTLMKPASPERATNADGFIQRWLLLEPIGANGLTDSAVQAAVKADYFPDQLTVVPHDGDKVSVGGAELTWHAVDSVNYNVNLFHFARAQGKKTSDALFWAVTVVNCPREMRGVRLSIGSNAASVWWVNGKEVIGIYGDRQTVIDDGVSKRLTLNQGPNVVRAAIINGGGATDFCARFLDAEDKPLKEITVGLGATYATPASVKLQGDNVNGPQSLTTPPAAKDWTEPFPPFKIAGNLYYVGSRGLANYLITTPQGHILINSDLEENVALIRASVERLGFKFTDIKVLLISHAHWDHNAASDTIKNLTGAKYMVMDADVPVVESGGKTDFQYGNDPTALYKPTKVDRVLHDGDEVKLGNTVLVAHLTPGHTKGCTTWTMKVQEAGKTYNVVIIGSPNVNPGYRLVNNSAYPQIAADYEKMFRVLNSLPCDIFLGAHGSYFDLETKYARLKESGLAAFIDPEGYKKFVADKERAFKTELAKQRAALPR